MGATGGVSDDVGQQTAKRLGYSWASQPTLRCSVKPSVPPMATSPSSSPSRQRFLDGCPHCWENMANGLWRCYDAELAMLE